MPNFSQVFLSAEMHNPLFAFFPPPQVEALAKEAYTRNPVINNSCPIYGKTTSLASLSKSLSQFLLPQMVGSITLFK